MADTSGRQYGVGMRHVRIFALDPVTGLPAATAVTAYEGLEAVGPKAFTINQPEVRKITHMGADRALALDFLPATEASSGELRIASNDLPLNAFLSSVNSFVVGETTMMPWQTDQQGYEPDVGMLLYQQSLDATSKLRRWRFFIIPKCRAIPIPTSLDENPAEFRYSLAPNPSANHLWGEAMTLVTEGAVEAGWLEGMAEGKPIVVAFKGDGATTVFNFPTGKNAVTVDKVVVWKNGVLVAAGITVAVTGVTFTVAPLVTDVIVVFYEHV